MIKNGIGDRFSWAANMSVALKRTNITPATDVLEVETVTKIFH